jgi:hypothetical protein
MPPRSGEGYLPGLFIVLVVSVILYFCHLVAELLRYMVLYLSL